MGDTPIPGTPGWNLTKDRRLFVPDVDLQESMWRQGRHLYFKTGIVENGQDICVICCLDEFVGEKDADRANVFLDRQREKVVRRIRSIRTITGEFLAAMERLQVEILLRAVGP